MADVDGVNCSFARGSATNARVTRLKLYLDGGEYPNASTTFEPVGPGQRRRLVVRAGLGRQ